MFSSSSEEFSKVVVTIILQIALHTLPVGIGLSRSSKIYWCRIREKQEVIDTILLGLLHKPLLSVAAGPVISTICIQIALGTTCLVVDIAICTLRSRTGTKIDTPARQTDTLGIALTVELLTEEPACSILLLRSTEIIADIFGSPAVAGTEILYSLFSLSSVDKDGGRWQSLASTHIKIIETIGGLAPTRTWIAPVTAQHNIDRLKCLPSKSSHINAYALPLAIGSEFAQIQLTALFGSIKAYTHLFGLNATIGHKSKDAIGIADNNRLLQVENQKVLPPVGIGYISGSNTFVGVIGTRFHGIIHHTRLHREETPLIVLVNFQLTCCAVFKVGQKCGLCICSQGYHCTHKNYQGTSHISIHVYS